MRNYEVTFIVDPVLSTDEIKATGSTYVEHLENSGCKIVAVDEMGLRQLAYPIKRRNSGIYYCIEFQSETGNLIDRLELALRRDERIMRFLTVALDKYGIKYNEDKRNGLIGKKRRKDNKPADTPVKPAAPQAPVKVAAPQAPVKETAPQEPVKAEAPAAQEEE